MKTEDTAPHPADHLKECLEARGMTSADLARAACLNRGRITEILNRKRKVTPRIALALENALNEPRAELWLALQSSWDLHQLRRMDQEIGNHRG